eukprot:5992859-Prymnesium_polylepis.1
MRNVLLLAARQARRKRKNWRSVAVRQLARGSAEWSCGAHGPCLLPAAVGRAYGTRGAFRSERRVDDCVAIDAAARGKSDGRSVGRSVSQCGMCRWPTPILTSVFTSGISHLAGGAADPAAEGGLA